MINDSYITLPFNSEVDPSLTDIDLSRLFERLIIGPTQYPTAMYEAFTEALSNMGITNAYEKISISNIPIRI